MRQVMAHRDPSSPTPMPTILRYGIAVLSVAIAIGLDFFLLRYFEAILTPFLFAVAATVWYAGTRPGVLAIVLSVLSLNYFFLRPGFSFSPISYADLVYLTFCIFCALAVGWVSAVRRRTEQELRQARGELEARVSERTADLQRSERYLTETQKLNHTGTWAWDARSQKVLFCSEEMFRIYGLDPQVDLPTRKNFRQRVHPEDRNRVDERQARVVNEKVGSFDEFRIVLPDGTVKYVSSTWHTVLDGNGELIELIGTATDITERKRAEEALRESERSARSALDGIAGLVAIMAPSGEVETGNRQCVEYFGRPVEEQKDWVTTDMVHPEDLPRMLENFKRAIVSEIPYHFEQRLRRFDGEYRWFETRGGAVRDDTGSVVRWYVLLTDIEDRMRALARLAQAQLQLAHANRVATMGQLTASITHEVNQPITAAVTYASAARRFLSAKPPNFREVDDALSLIVKEGNRAGEVVGRIRALIKKAPARKDAVEIND